MVRVFRKPLGAWCWELPRGFSDPGETPRATAVRELNEETGVHVDESALIELGPLAPNGGILESVVQLFAVQLSRAETLNPGDLGEVSRICWVPISTYLERIASGDIFDSFTVAATARAVLKGIIEA